MVQPLLSFCIPAYNRPILLTKALHSIIDQPLSSENSLEIVISDDSTTDELGKNTAYLLQSWAGKWSYFWNNPKLGMAANWNNAINLANGEYVIVLHDDDFLLPNGVNNLISSISNYKDNYQVFLFGVHVVYENEKLFKKQVFTKELYLPPKEAIKRLMCDSSFVRFPAIAMSKKVFQEVGYFDDYLVGGAADLQMWIKLFSKYGVFCVPHATAAYRIHEGALTTGMFNADVVSKILLLYHQVESLKILDDATLKDCQGKFFHQFILGGTYRQIRQKNLTEAAQIMELFNLEAIKGLKVPRKWLLVRRVFEALISGFKWGDRLFSKIRRQ